MKTVGRKFYAFLLSLACFTTLLLAGEYDPLSLATAITIIGGAYMGANVVHAKNAQQKDGGKNA